MNGKQYVKLTNGKLVFYENGRWFEQWNNCIQEDFGVEGDLKKFSEPKPVKIINDACAECNGLLTCHGESGECHKGSGFSDSQKIKLDVLEEKDSERGEAWNEESLVDVCKSCAEVKDAVKDALGRSYYDEEQSLVREILKGKVGWNLRGRS